MSRHRGIFAPISGSKERAVFAVLNFRCSAYKIGTGYRRAVQGLDYAEIRFMAKMHDEEQLAVPQVERVLPLTAVSYFWIRARI